jgi:ABC-type glycerol-3-phosphate transport system substrate-binding protein
MINRLKLTFLVLVAALSCAGCSSENVSNVSKEAATPEPKQKELMMWLAGSEGQAQTIAEVAGEFTRRTNVKVKCEAISWGEAHSKYLTSIAGGVAPDIGTMGLTWGTEFGTLGAMVDLNREYPEDVKKIKDAVFPGMWGSIEYRGKVFGIPFDMTEYVLYYRNDIIPAPPTTWGELTALLAELDKKGKGMIFDWGSMSWIGFSPFLWQAGGDFYNEDYTQVTVDGPAAVVAMRFFADLYTKYKVPKTKIPLEQGMRTGDFPLAISGNWKIDGLRLSAPEIAGKWSIALLPKGPSGKRTAFIGGRILGIFSQSKNRKEAWEFMKFLFEPSVGTKLYRGAYLKQDTYLPPNMTTWASIEMDPAFKAVLIEQAKDAKGPPPVMSWDSGAKYIDEAIQKVILRNADPKQELGSAKVELERLLNKK